MCIVRFCSAGSNNTAFPGGEYYIIEEAERVRLVQQLP